MTVLCVNILVLSLYKYMICLPSLLFSYLYPLKYNEEITHKNHANPIICCASHHCNEQIIRPTSLENTLTTPYQMLMLTIQQSINLGSNLAVTQ